MALGGLHQIRDIRGSSANLQSVAKDDKLYHFVSFDGSGDFDIPAAGDAAFILVADEGVGGATVVLVGKEKVVAGTGGFSAGDRLAADADGTAVVATTGQVVNAVALQDAAAGEMATVLVIPASEVLA